MYGRWGWSWWWHRAITLTVLHFQRQFHPAVAAVQDQAGNVATT
jgi:hypothetical protein